MDKFFKFIGDFIEDIFIVIGVILICIATFNKFGVDAALYTLGGFLLLLGILNHNNMKRK
jgi:hypothetical protein